MRIACLLTTTLNDKQIAKRKNKAAKNTKFDGVSNPKNREIKKRSQNRDESKRQPQQRVFKKQAPGRYLLANKQHEDDARNNNYDSQYYHCFSLLK